MRKLLFVGVIAALVASSLQAQSVSFTGDVATDFAGAVFILDPGGISDVGVPSALAGSIPGWEMSQVALAYDETTDELKIGIDTLGICGDADGDGDPSVTSPALAGNGGQDTANFSGQEVFTISLDLDNDGVPDVVTGVDASSDITGARNRGLLRFALRFVRRFRRCAPGARSGTDHQSERGQPRPRSCHSRLRRPLEHVRDARSDLDRYPRVPRFAR